MLLVRQRHMLRHQLVVRNVDDQLVLGKYLDMIYYIRQSLYL